jgi:hypothetical protein
VLSFQSAMPRLFAESESSVPFVEDSVERRIANQGRHATPADERVADAGTISVGSEGLPRMEMSQELLLLGAQAPNAGSAPRTTGVGRLLVRAQMNNPDNPEVLAVVPLPTPEERRRREIMLARVLLLAVDQVLAGDPLGLEPARDLLRELRHCYPELVDEYL